MQSALGQADQVQHNSTTNTLRYLQTATTTPTAWTENAYDWFQRSRRKRALADIPHDPPSAAWAFVRPRKHNKSVLSIDATLSPSSVLVGGTGIAFIDAALQQKQLQQQQQQTTQTINSPLRSQLPVMDICGESCIGKTSILMSLAARFVVATRSSQFGTNPEIPTSQDSYALPRVILLDSTHDITVSKLAYIVRSSLLKNSPSNDVNIQKRLQDDMVACLSRIHMASVSNNSEWIPILESFRCQLSTLTATTQVDHPTLILWDGLSDCLYYEDSNRMEIIRQIVRLLHECSILFVSTTTQSTGSFSGTRWRHIYDWEKHVTHKIQLERSRLNRNSSIAVESSIPSAEEFTATISDVRIPFSISLAGVLS